VLCFWEATQRQDSQGNDSSLGWWVILGGALGLGLLSKYTMALFFPCAFLYLWFSRRSQLRIAGFCLSTLIAIVLFAPVLLWNFNNEWVSLRHVMGQTGLSNASPGFSAKSFFEFLGSQLGAISPLLFPATIVGVIRGCYLRDRVCRDRFLVLAMFSGPVLSFFFLWSVYHKVQGNWAAVAYVTAVIALAAWWDESMDKKAATRGGRVMSMFPLLLLPGVFTVVIAHFPAVLNQIGIDLPPRLDLTRRLQGWQELGLATGALLQSRGHSGPFLMSDTYQIASELAFYVPGQPRVYNVNLGRRMNQYDIWGGLDALKDKDGFFVTRGDVDVPTALVQMCRTVRKVKVVTSYHRGHKAQVFSIFECDGYRGAVNQSPVLY
jgi:undecaprenyl-diphosphatase